MSNIMWPFKQKSKIHTPKESFFKDCDSNVSLMIEKALNDDLKSLTWREFFELHKAILKEHQKEFENK